MERSVSSVPLRERKKAGTKARLRSTALELFSEHGFAGVSVDQIAHEADVSRSTFFRYFGSKEEVLFESIDAAGAAFVSDLERRPSDEPPGAAFKQALLASAEAQSSRVTELPDENRVVDGLLRNDPALRGRHLKELERWTQEIADVFARRAGRKGAELPDRLAAAVCMAVNEEVARAWRSDPLAEPAALIEEAFVTLQSVGGA